MTWDSTLLGPDLPRLPLRQRRSSSLLLHPWFCPSLLYSSRMMPFAQSNIPVSFCYFYFLSSNLGLPLCNSSSIVHHLSNSPNQTYDMHGISSYLHMKEITIITRLEIFGTIMLCTWVVWSCFVKMPNAILSNHSTSNYRNGSIALYNINILYSPSIRSDI
jgi:hypothetical protein